MSSVYANLLSAVEGAVQAVAAQYAPGARVVTRKAPYDLKGVDSYPLIVICPEGERDLGGTFGSLLHLAYPVMVVVVTEWLLDNPPDWQLTLREELRGALFVTTWTAVPEVWDCQYEPAPAFDGAQLEGGLDVSVQRFTYSSRETR